MATHQHPSTYHEIVQNGRHLGCTIGNDKDSGADILGVLLELTGLEGADILGVLLELTGTELADILGIYELSNDLKQTTKGPTYYSAIMLQ